ncbi:MAG: serine/threonine-protein kinase [Kofleriaceae bacterium]
MNCPHCTVPNPDDARFCASCGKATAATEPVSASHPGFKPSPDPIGKEIAGRYRIQAKLGEGGMGAVYKAEQISLKRTCAVKVLRPDVAGTSIMLRRFNAEAEAVAKLSHPNTVNIYDFGQDTDGTFFIAMEYVEGGSLREAIHAEAPFATKRALSIASQVAASLTDAHSHSIIHRDLKPDNVMLQSRGRAKDVARVLDFGIAKLRDEGRATQAAMTQAGDMLGTPQYMAPEQIRAEQIDGRTDVYALGCMLYEMVTARLPFEGPTIMALLSKHLMETPQSPSQRRPDLGIPPQIDQLIMSAIAKDPNARPATMETFGEQINALLATMPESSHGMTAQRSAVGQAMVPASTPTPGAYGGFSPHTPPPQGYQQPPHGYPTPQPPAPPPSYGTPQAQYSPYAQPIPPTVRVGGQQHGVAAHGGGGNTKLLLIILAVLVLGGGAVAAVVLVTRDSKPEVIAKAGDAGTEDPAVKKPDDPGIKKPDDPGIKKPDDPGIKKPDDPTKGEADDDDDTDPKADDPWSGGGAPTSSSDVIDRLGDFKTRMCACSDMACGAKISSDMTAWSEELAKHPELMTKMDAASMQRMSQITQEFAVCAQKLTGTSGLSKVEPPKPKPKPVTLTPIQQLQSLASRACGCHNATCGRGLMREFMAFVQRHRNTPGDMQAAEAAGKRFGECIVKTGVPITEIQADFQKLGS